MIDKQELIELLESEELGFEEFVYDAASKANLTADEYSILNFAYLIRNGIINVINTIGE